MAWDDGQGMLPLQEFAAAGLAIAMAPMVKAPARESETKRFDVRCCKFICELLDSEWPHLLD